MIIKITDKLKKNIPYTCGYVERYGKKLDDGSYDIELISTFETPARYKHEPELLYKECMESGKEWTDIVSRVKGDMIL